MKISMPFIFMLLISFSTYAQGIVFIVNENNPITHLTAFQISEIFMKRNRSWPDATPIRFFDRENDSSARRIFLKNVLKKSSRELDQYWIGQKLYTGNSAPVQVEKDSIAMSLVSRFPGAISYVLSTNFKDRKGIKKIEIIGNQ